MLQIRNQLESDKPRLYTLFEECFAFKSDPKCLDTLGNISFPPISLVALVDGELVGHILFTRACIHHENRVSPTLSLAYLAVTPSMQHRGIGKALVNAGLGQCKYLDCHVIPTLGDPAYFTPLQFHPATAYHITASHVIAPTQLLVYETAVGKIKEGAMIQFPMELLRFSKLVGILPTTEDPLATVSTF